MSVCLSVCSTHVSGITHQNFEILRTLLVDTECSQVKTKVLYRKSVSGFHVVSTAIRKRLSPPQVAKLMHLIKSVALILNYNICFSYQ